MKFMKLTIQENRVSIKYCDNVIEAKIQKAGDELYYFETKWKPNDTRFEIVGIKNKYEFQKKVLGYNCTIMSDFPYCKSRDDVIKLLKELVSIYNKKHGCSNLGKPLKRIKLNFKL